MKLYIIDYKFFSDEWMGIYHYNDEDRYGGNYKAYKTEEKEYIMKKMEIIINENKDNKLQEK